MPTALCVYCGSSSGNHPEYIEQARAFGTEMARRGIALVYGGGKVGLMGTVADAVLAAGGKVIGVIPRQLVDLEVAHAGLTELVVVDTMHQRKTRMFELSDASSPCPAATAPWTRCSKCSPGPSSACTAIPALFWTYAATTHSCAP